MTDLRRPVLLTAILLAMALIAAPDAHAVGQPVKPGAASSAQFPSAQGCSCHGPLQAQWQASMHAQAVSDPLYQTKLADAQAASGGTLGAFCNTCHSPVGTMSGEFSADATLSPVGAEGVTCTFCHQATGLAEGEPGNTNHLVEPVGIMRAQLEDPQAPHPAQYSEFHTTSEICGGCHNVRHPINGMHLEATYAEWKKSPYAAEGVSCQDCHMSVKPGVVGPSTAQVCSTGPERPNAFTMTFTGGQVALGDSQRATEMLKSAAKVSVDAPDVVAAGEEASVTVTVANVGAGHYLPTGLTEVREMWLEVFATGADGKKVPLGERRFGTVLRDDKGNYPVELWEATAVQSDDRIPPKGSVEATYTFAMPEGVTTAKLTAALYYRSAPEEFAAKAGVDNPVTTMAQASSSVWASEEARAAAQEPEGQSPTVWIVGLAVLIAVAGIAIVAFRRLRSRG